MLTNRHLKRRTLKMAIGFSYWTGSQSLLMTNISTPPIIIWNWKSIKIRDSESMLLKDQKRCPAYCKFLRLRWGVWRTQPHDNYTQKRFMLVSQSHLLFFPFFLLSKLSVPRQRWQKKQRKPHSLSKVHYYIL